MIAKNACTVASVQIVAGNQTSWCDAMAPGHAPWRKGKGEGKGKGDGNGKYESNGKAKHNEDASAKGKGKPRLETVAGGGFFGGFSGRQTRGTMSYRELRSMCHPPSPSG